MAICVDDLIIASRTPALVKKTISDLKGHFQVKELGSVKWALGISRTRIRVRNHDHPSKEMHQRHGRQIRSTRCSPHRATLRRRGREVARRSNRLRPKAGPLIPIHHKKPAICSGCNATRHQRDSHPPLHSHAIPQDRGHEQSHRGPTILERHRICGNSVL